MPDQLTAPHPIQRRYLAEQLVRLRRADEQQRYAAAQRQGRIDPNPHQIDAVIFALKRRVVEVGNQRYRYVAIVHPTTAVQWLRDNKKIPDKWWNAYVARKVETREPTHEQRQKKKESARKVVPMVPTAKARAPKKATSK